MNIHLPVLNAFIEDTCVIAVIAYLLARGRVLDLLFLSGKTRNQRLMLGLLFGLIGVSEIVFPGARAPYVVHTLLVTFATITGGLSVGVVAAITVAVGGVLLRSSLPPVEFGLTLAAAALLAEVIRRAFRGRYTLIRGGIAGTLVQLAIVLANNRYNLTSVSPPELHVALLSAPANGLGVLLLQLIVNEARTRTEGERHRIAAERSQALVYEAQLASLRARVHPHFLFNTLTSIAALCSIAPPQAEQAIVRLSQLMRRALETGSSAQSLIEELEYVRSYLAIEQYRLGDRMSVIWETYHLASDVTCPPFAIQMLVENAVNHGIFPSMRSGEIRIVVHRKAAWVVVAVIDNGVGMDHSKADSIRYEHVSREHGLEILNRQLTILYGPLSRLRIFSEVDKGTMACFRLPLNYNRVVWKDD